MTAALPTIAAGMARDHALAPAGLRRVLRRPRGPRALLEERAERRDRWLFLTPEMERLAPGLLAALAPAAGARTTATEEEDRLDRLVRSGTPEAWFAELRRCRTLLEAAWRNGAPVPLVRRLALILREQYLLAPGVLDVVPEGDAELERLRGILDATADTSDRTA